MSDQQQTIRLIMALRRQGIVDSRVLSALEQIPREIFVRAELRDEAYEDKALPIACGQTVSQPFIVALMTQLLDVGERMKVLEIGTGSGYQAAILAKLCRRIYTLERHRTLLREAEARFAALDLTNITGRLGDGLKGWPEQAPFDRIIVTAAFHEVPARLLEQLKPDGILVMPVGGADHQTLMRVRMSDRCPQEERHLPVRFVPLLEGIAKDTPDP